MTDNTAYVLAMIECAAIERASMQAANDERKHRGESMAYGESAFMALIEKYGIHHNAVVTELRR